MKTIQLGIFAILMCFSLFIKAQPFPYLNASTGNEGQYIVDADTNIIMYHGNQIEKLDKNLNPIWVKTYSGLYFHSLLLSKTGSIFFISKNDSLSHKYTHIIGKLNVDGSLSWCKKILSHQSSNETYINNLLLNRDNYLIASAVPKGLLNPYDTTAWFIKLDTLGQIVTSKQFKLGYSVSPFITSDSLGSYRFIGPYQSFEHGGILTYRYSEISNTISSSFQQYSAGQFETINEGKYYISKYEPYTYYSLNIIGSTINSNWRTLLQKHKHNNVVWRKILSNSVGGYFFDGFDEDMNGNVYFTMSTDGSPFVQSQVTKVPPGNQPCKEIKYISQSFPYSPPSLKVSSKIHIINDNKFLHDLYGSQFPNNPLTLTLLDSTLNSNCSTSSILTHTLSSGSGSAPLTTQVINYPNYYVQNLFPTVTSVTNFSLNMNYCLYMGEQELNTNVSSIEIYPNPALNELKISLKNQQEILGVKIFDIKGSEVLKSTHSIIDISSLSKGLYLIKVKTDKGEFSQKFIKE